MRRGKRVIHKPLGYEVVFPELNESDGTPLHDELADAAERTLSAAFRTMPPPEYEVNQLALIGQAVIQLGVVSMSVSSLMQLNIEIQQETDEEKRQAMQEDFSARLLQLFEEWEYLAAIGLLSSAVHRNQLKNQE